MFSALRPEKVHIHHILTFQDCWGEEDDGINKQFIWRDIKPVLLWTGDLFNLWGFIDLKNNPPTLSEYVDRKMQYS